MSEIYKNIVYFYRFFYVNMFVLCVHKYYNINIITPKKVPEGILELVYRKKKRELL